jgi:uncharacterized membrane protein YdjX (TVP38/TMEM64 family)
MKKIIAVVLGTLPGLFLSAQGNDTGNTMNQHGKIYVVVAVMLTILAGLFLYLLRLDRKISKLEKNS